MELPISFLHECFVVIGKDLVWKERPRHHFLRERSFIAWNNKYPGTVAGFKLKTRTTTYRKIRMESKITNSNFNAHRIAFALHYGYHAKNFVDHIDGDGLNNSKENLRDITNAESNKNMQKRSCSKSAISGVSFREEKNRWYATIHTNRTKTHLGCFSNLFDACCAKISEQNKRGFTPRHGR